MSDTPRTDACLADLKTRSGFLPDAKWVDLCRELERGSARVGLKPSLCATCGQTKYLPDPNCALAGCPGSASNGRGPNDGGFCDCFSKCGDAPGWEDKLCRQPHGMLASPPVGACPGETPRTDAHEAQCVDLYGALRPAAKAAYALARSLEREGSVPKMARPASEITCPFCHGVWTLGPMPDVPPKVGEQQ